MHAIMTPILELVHNYHQDGREMTKKRILMHAIVTPILKLVHNYHHDGREMACYTTYHQSVHMRCERQTQLLLVRDLGGKLITHHVGPLFDHTKRRQNGVTQISAMLRRTQSTQR